METLLEFAQQTQLTLEKLPGNELANFFIESKIKCFHKYQNGRVTSSSHGLDFFFNVIRYWDNPESYYIRKDKNNYIDYEENFVLILKENKD